MQWLKTTLGHQRFSSWPYLLGALALIASVAGAAAGTVLSGGVGGVVPVSVSQALLVETVQVIGGDLAQGFRSDDGTEFTAAVELNTGDSFETHLALVNESDEDLVGELLLDFPLGISLSVEALDGADQVLRTGLGSWLFDLESNHTNDVIDLIITVALADDIPPGFFEITGELRQINLKAEPTPTPTPVPIADISITKTATPDPVTVGGNLTYTVVVSNSGPASASNIVMTDALPSGVTLVAVSTTQGSCNGTSVITCNLGTLNSGATATVTIIVSPSSTGSLTNTAIVGGGIDDPDGTNNTTTSTTTVDPATADLSISKSDSPDPVTVGNSLSYTLAVINSGPNAAPGVVVTDTLPAGVTFLSSSTTQGTCSGTSPVTCNLGTLNSGGSATITIVVIPTTAGSISNSTVVASAANDPDSSNDSAATTTTVNPPTADLSISKSDSPDPVTVGGSLTYSLTVSNSGPNAAANVVVTDTLPASATLLLTSPTQGSCTGTSTVTCNLGTLNNGATATIVIVVTPTSAGSISNAATVTSTTNDPNNSNDSTTTTTTVNPPTADLSISKSDSPDPVTVGNSLSYTLAVTNYGPNAADSVVVTDILPAGVTFVSSTTTQGSCSGTSTITCNLGTINSVAGATITIVVTPTSGGSIANSATVASTTNDPNSANDSTTTTTTVNPPVAKLYVVDKSDDMVYVYADGGTFLGTESLAGPNSDPRGITTDASTDFWVVDHNDEKVYKYDSDFATLTNFSLASGNEEPEGITTGGNKIYVVDEDDESDGDDDDDNDDDDGDDDDDDGRVFVYNMDGTYTGTSFGLSHDDPTGITTDGQNLYILDHDSKKVRKYTTTGSFVSSFSLATNSGNPQGITTDGTHIWVLSKSVHQIKKYTLSGTLVSTFSIDLPDNNNGFGLTVAPR